MAKPNTEAANSVVGLLLGNGNNTTQPTKQNNKNDCKTGMAELSITESEKKSMLQSSPLRHKKQLMNSNGRIKKGVWISPEVDTLLDMEAVKLRISKSDCVEMIFRKYFNI